jgi:methylenetetrahydrofolate reductase (NADPH)
MKIIQVLRDSPPTSSFEFFPPRTDDGFDNLYHTIRALKPLAPTFVSVTYGAGGSTRAKTVQLVERIRNEIGIESMAHLTCVGATREEIAAVLDELDSAGIENVLALRGDPPQGAERFVPVEGGFAHANELVEFIRANYSFCVGVAGYPEKHPEAPGLRQDLANLKRKVDAGADFIISQLFFDNRDFYRFRELAEYEGIRVPIIAGIMPVLSVKQIKRFTSMCGARIPDVLLRRIEAVEDDEEAVRHIGMYHATEQCYDLMRSGVAGLHFYTLNRSTATRAICQYLRAEREG